MSNILTRITAWSFALVAVVNLFYAHRAGTHGDFSSMCLDLLLVGFCLMWVWAYSPRV